MECEEPEEGIFKKYSGMPCATILLVILIIFITFLYYITTS